MTLDLPLIITGPIGSGKSFIARCFKERGWAVLDSDEVGHQVLAEPKVIAAISQRWPRTVVGGSVNRSLLADRVFTDPAALAALEHLTHPRIKQRIDDWLDGGPALKAVEMSVLRTAISQRGTRLVIDAPLGTRIDRLERRGMTQASIRQRMSAQPDRAEWLAAGQLVLDNTESGIGAADHLIAYLERFI